MTAELSGSPRGTIPRIDAQDLSQLPKTWMLLARLRPLARLTATVALAYALAVQSLLGAMGQAAFAGEIRLANQLGVICTIHGPQRADPADGTSDPTPGRMACIEHCVPALGQPHATHTLHSAQLPVERPLRFTGWPVIQNGATALYRAGGPPPPTRGPPVT